MGQNQNYDGGRSWADQIRSGRAGLIAPGISLASGVQQPLRVCFGVLVARVCVDQHPDLPPICPPAGGEFFCPQHMSLITKRATLAAKARRKHGCERASPVTVIIIGTSAQELALGNLNLHTQQSLGFKPRRAIIWAAQSRYICRIYL